MKWAEWAAPALCVVLALCYIVVVEILLRSAGL
jgi:hypothetical protein